MQLFNARALKSSYLGKPSQETEISLIRWNSELEAQVNALQAELDKFRTVFEHIQWGVVICTTDGKLVMMNPEYARMHGYSIEELPGMPIEAVFPPEYRGQVPEDLVKIHRYGRYVYRCPHLRKDGSVFPVEVDASVIKDKKGQPLYQVINVWDITEKVRLEQEIAEQRCHLEQLVDHRTSELKTSNQKLKEEVLAKAKIESELRKAKEQTEQILESILDGFFALDREWRFTYINGVAKRLAGFAQDENILGKQFSEVFPLASAFVPNYQEAMSGQSAVHSEVFYPASRTWWEVHAYPCAGGMAVYFRDITLRKRAIKSLEEERNRLYSLLQQKKKEDEEIAKLERLNVIGEMAAGIAHEIRNPMTAVRGFLQLLEGKQELNNYRRFFSLMIGELDRANSIISEFLSIARNTSGYIKPGNIKSLVASLYPLLMADALSEEKNVEVNLQEVPDLIMNEEEIRQLVLNLARNGLEAMPAGGTLTLKTYSDDNQIVLAVKDQGGGIDPDILPKLGTPFLTSKKNGTGLGLAVCYGIAARHNARLDFETGPQGTEFRVRFSVPGQ